MKIRQLIEWVQARFDSALPPALFAGYLFFSVLMVVSTAATGLGAFPLTVEQELRTKGFFWEINWGLNHLFLVPPGLFCCALVLREIGRQTERISSARMAVDGTFTDIPLAEIQKDWSRVRPGAIWFGTIACISFLVSWGEWWIGSAGPIFGYIEREPIERIGWTAAATVDPNINRTINALLSFLAFTAQGFITTYFCYTVAIVLGFATWIYRYDDAAERKLIPDVKSDDIRRGFEVFEPLMLRLLCMALTFTFVLFSIRMQIIYNSSKSPAETSLVFVLQDVVNGFFTNMQDVFAGRQNDLFEISLAPVYGMVIACTAMVVVVSVVTIFPTVILYFLARDSRDSLRRCLAQAVCPPCNSRNMSQEDCAKRLQTMDFWPLRYPRPMELLAYIVFAAFCFVFYKFTVVLFGVIVMRLVHVVYLTLTKNVPGPPAGAGGGS
ncbi:MAG: hypothetical protein HY290_06415 [Planctomycetia bacterium]|nr:hypothetical protein [Planctomycetia bacterium]